MDNLTVFSTYPLRGACGPPEREETEEKEIVKSLINAQTSFNYQNFVPTVVSRSSLDLFLAFPC